GARVVEQVAVLIGGQPRVEQHRHDAGPDGSPEQNREFHRVEQDKRDPVFLFDPHARQHRPDARSSVAQLAIGEDARPVDEYSLIAAALGDIAIDEIDSRVVVAKGSHPDAPLLAWKLIKARVSAAVLDFSHGAARTKQCQLAARSGNLSRAAGSWNPACRP